MKLLKVLLFSTMLIAFWLFNANGVKYYTPFCTDLRNKYYDENKWRKSK